jgi:hypothetical protein
VTNAELLDLLRESRVSVQFHIGLLAWSNNHSPLKTAKLAKAEETLARIDAALAERQDKPPCSCGQPYPCMKGCPDCCHSQGYLDYCQGDRHAERADSATDVVEWAYDAGTTQKAAFLDMELFVWPSVLHHSYKWSVTLTRNTVHYSIHGYCATEAEAKSAAIAAARGMK